MVIGPVLSAVATMVTVALAFAGRLPKSQTTMPPALTTMLAMLMSKEENKIPWTREMVVLLMFWAWMLITTLNSLFPELAYIILFLPMIFVIAFRPQGLFGRVGA